jgi:hypothetical protein
MAIFNMGVWLRIGGGEIKDSLGGEFKYDMFNTL